jgi:glycosyltransferase involved in cell wall biosynthesis
MVARQKGVPSVVDIPTWHRNKGRKKPFETKSERERRALRGWRGIKENLVPSRQRTLMEYELADVIHVQSDLAAQTFVDVGIDPAKLFYVARGVDVDRYQPASPPGIFRLVYVGALIKRKGVHHLLEAWHRLALKDAELVLVGNAHDEIRPALDDFMTDSVRLVGFAKDVRDYLGSASAFTLTSECEGSAKVCYEAAACALPQISTRESGDVVIDGLNGTIVPPNDVDALAAAIRDFYDHPEKLEVMGRAGRARVVEQFTWDHYRVRVLHSYAYARRRAGLAG